MSTVKIPMPLRVPELAPSLGRVVVPRRVAEPWVPIDDIREALATRVLELAGEARAAATREDRERVLDAVSRRAWLAAWEQAVRRVAERLIEALDGRIERAARRVRMPQRRWRRRLLSTPEKRAVGARTLNGRKRCAVPRAGSRRRGSPSRRWRPRRSGAGARRSKRWNVGDRRSGRCSSSGLRSPRRCCGWGWCSAATFPLRYGSPRASASRAGAPAVSAIGVGVDLVEVARVSAILKDKGARVLERLLTPAERAYCESRPDVATHVAVRLAAKEAVYKALQGSPAARGIGWRDIEVTRAPDGRPDVSLSGSATERARELGVQRVLLSLSHTHLAAIAVAVLESD